MKDPPPPTSRPRVGGALILHYLTTRKRVAPRRPRVGGALILHHLTTRKRVAPADLVSAER